MLIEVWNEFIRKENKEINEKKMKGETVIAVLKRFKRRAEKWANIIRIQIGWLVSILRWGNK